MKDSQDVLELLFSRTIMERMDTRIGRPQSWIDGKNGLSSDSIVSVRSVKFADDSEYLIQVTKLR